MNKKRIIIIMLIIIIIFIEVIISIIHFSNKNDNYDSIYSYIIKNNSGYTLVFTHKKAEKEKVKSVSDVWEIDNKPVDLESFNPPPLPWHSENYTENITKVLIKDRIKPTSMAYWFYNFTNLKSIEKIQNIDTTETKYMMSLFQNSSIEQIDLSSFTFENTIETVRMFKNCTNLKAIYVKDTIDLSNVQYSAGMFDGTTNIIGGNGTKYNPDHLDKEYARIDTPQTPGYFTNK